MSMIITFLIGITAVCASLTIASVLMVRLLSTKVLVGLFLVSSVTAIYCGWSLSNQMHDLILNLSPTNIIKSIDLFAN